jgi:nucleoside-diphosphate-sugar epimerase
MRNEFNKYKGRAILITGGLGFIGSNLAKRLVEIGNVSVNIIDSLDENQGGNIFNVESIKSSVKIHVADLADNYITNHLIGGIDYIFNLAGSVSHIDSMTMPLHDLKSNCEIHLSLLEACRAFNPRVKILFTSTRQVYGRPLYLPVDEKHRIQPTDVNGINKYAAEMYHLLYQRVYGLRSVVLRLTNSYGPGQQMHHNRQGFFPWFLRQAMKGEVINLYGDGQHHRDLNYVDDVVDALLLAGTSEAADGEIFNLGHHETLSLREIAERIIQVTGRGSTVGVPFPAATGLTEIGNCHSSYEKIQKALDWSPKVNLSEGIKRTVQFYEAYGRHYWSADEYSVSRP